MGRYQFPSSSERSTFLSYGAAVRHGALPRQRMMATTREVALVTTLLLLIAALGLVS